MRALRISALIVVSAIAMTARGQAADMPGMPGLPRMLPSPPIAQEFFSDWYLRGDIGVRFNNFSGGSALGEPYTGFKQSEAVAFGGGIGTRVFWLRGDITLDYAPESRFAGATAIASPDARAKLSALTTLFNAYVDLGAWYGITPYVGAGIGFTYLQPYSASAFLLAPGDTVSNHGTVNFSWAAIAGLSFPVLRQVRVDVNYRYLAMGGARTSTDLGTIHYRNMQAHEIRTGLRYSFSD
jgi:opacity protein-like surface antigen